MRKRIALTSLILALTAGGGAALAANPHAWTALSLSQEGCTVIASASWSATRVARVEFYFVSVPGGQYAVVTRTVEPRPARSGTLAATATAPDGQPSGQVTALFVSPQENYVASMTESYTCA